MSERPTVVLGVTGCIAAYKACELVRELGRRGVRVRVVMTEAATRMVGPATFRALTREPVAVSLWEEAGAAVHHISLAEEARVLAIAPCTANVLAKLAQGRADDLLTAVALACEAPLVLAPAMNVHMWRREATQANLRVLRERGAVVVDPESGELACGEAGEGRLAGIGEIADAIETEARRARSLSGVRVLVTAGGTREPLDAVRFLGNRSSGKTGLAIAEEAARRGASVTLVAAACELPDPFGVETVRVETALQMREEVLARFAQSDAVVMTAAVADFRPAQASSEKVKKDEMPLELRLERTPDILAELGAARGSQVLVGFAAETADPVGEARLKLARKGCDLVVANDVTETGMGFGSETNRWWLVRADSAEEVGPARKRALAGRLLDELTAMLEERAS